MKTAIYARTKDATTEQDRMQKQIAMCMARADDQEVKIYKDFGSGTDVLRPELQRMMKDIRACKIQRVIVQDVARLSRNLLHLTELTREMQEYGCTLLSLAEEIDTGRMHDENVHKLIDIWDKRRHMHEMESGVL